MARSDPQLRQARLAWTELKRAYAQKSREVRSTWSRVERDAWRSPEMRALRAEETRLRRRSKRAFDHVQRLQSERVGPAPTEPSTNPPPPPSFETTSSEFEISEDQLFRILNSQRRRPSPAQ